MKPTKEKLEKTLEMMGVSSFMVALDESARKISITIENEPAFAANLPNLVANLNHLAKLFGKKDNEAPIIVDINNYRKDREAIIVDLARAAATRAVSTKEPVQLPAMTAYERMLVHTELGARADIKTESVGEGKDRMVIVKAV